jgi:hypothetical protein
LACSVLLGSFGEKFLARRKFAINASSYKGTHAYKTAPTGDRPWVVRGGKRVYELHGQRKPKASAASFTTVHNGTAWPISRCHHWCRSRKKAKNESGVQVLGVDGDHRGCRDNAVGCATTAVAVPQSAAITIGTPLAPRLRTDTVWRRHGK